jgi:hypothetical protein
MSVATEFPPTVYIPERARSAVRGGAVEAGDAFETGSAVQTAAVEAGDAFETGRTVRHLALVPAPSPAVGAPARRVERLPRRTADERVAGRRFADSAVDWPLTVTPAAAPMRLTRRGVVLLLLATLAAGLLLLAVARASRPGSAGSTGGTGSVPAAGSVQVQPGDTLWSIAQRVAPQRDPRQVVDKLRRLNHLHSVSLTPGQTLKVG